MKRVPEKFGTYYEPFLGGGALFFALQPECAVLGDLNHDLVNCYEQVRANVGIIVGELTSGFFKNESERFYEIRAAESPVGTFAAARMIYLNKTAFNGLYRVNSKGQFNAPFGRYKNPTICDEENLRACSAALGRTKIYWDEYEMVVRTAVAGDFIYFDPPYIPLSPTSNFTAYTAGGFGHEQHVKLRDLALELKNRGVHVLLSNSGSPLVEELYGKDFKLEAVSARRNINRNGSARGAVKEYLIS
jgi:DNA adenine methylase